MHEQRLEADDMRLNGGVEKMRGNALDFFGHHAQVAGALGNGDAEHVFHHHAVGEGVAVGAQRAHAFGEGDVLDEVALGSHGFHAAVHVTGGQLHVANCFTIHREVEIYRFLKGHVYGAQRHGEGVTHGCAPCH